MARPRHTAVSGMISFRTLGGVELKDAHGRDLRALLSQPKRLALLASLGVNNHHQHYLALRLDPEPIVRSEVDTVRARLGRLSGPSVVGMRP